MEGVIFEKATDYIQSCKTLAAKIAAIDAIIEKLLISISSGAESGHLDEYWFDDGHVKIRNKYRSVQQMSESLKAFETMRNYYANNKNGRILRLKDHSNFYGSC